MNRIQQNPAENNFPLANIEEVTSVETELDEIDDEDVPLSDVPQTGSASAFYLIMTVASVIGLIGVNASKHDKKNR